MDEDQGTNPMPTEDPATPAGDDTSTEGDNGAEPTQE